MPEAKNFKILFVEDDEKMLKNEQEDIEEINSSIGNLFESNFILVPQDLSSDGNAYNITKVQNIHDDILYEIEKIVKEYKDNQNKYLVVVDMELFDHNYEESIRFVGRAVYETLQKKKINSILVSAVSDSDGPTIVRPNPQLWKDTYCRRSAAISIEIMSDNEELNKLIETYSQSFLLRKQYLSRILYEFVKKNYNGEKNVQRH